MRNSADRTIDEIFCRSSNWWDILQIVQGAEWTPFSFYSRSVLRTTATDSANFTCQVWGHLTFCIDSFTVIFQVLEDHNLVTQLPFILGHLYWSSTETIQTKEKYSAVMYVLKDHLSHVLKNQGVLIKENFGRDENMTITRQWTSWALKPRLMLEASWSMSRDLRRKLKVLSSSSVLLSSYHILGVKMLFKDLPVSLLYINLADHLII